jgi:subtilisin family serine protease
MRRPVDTVIQMMRAQSFRGLARGSVVALLAAVVLILPGTALAMEVSGTLSPRLAELAGPALRDASPGQQARAVGLAVDGLARRGKRVLATIRFDAGALASRDELRRAGAKTLAASGPNQLVTVAATPAQLRTIAKVRGVEGVTPVHAPVTAAATCPSGAIVSEGDAQLKASAAREANPGIDGSGVEVGILSDSLDQANESGQGGPIATHAAEDVESGDLPGANGCANATPIEVLSPMSNGSEASDEGRAMTQIVHDLAPGASLDFASAFNGELAFAQNIKALADAGAEVIADDVFYLEEPFFQDGPVAVAVNEAVEEDGVAYFSAAGNDNLIDEEGHDIASWETPKFRDAGACPPAVRAVSILNPLHCLDFNPGLAVDKTFGVEVEAGETLAVDLQWDEPWFGVGTDLDAFLLNSTGSRIAESHEDNVAVTQTPVEILEWENTTSSPRTVQLVVNRFAGGDPRLKFALVENGSGVSATEYPQSSGEDVVGPTIFGHSGAANAISVGAVFRQEIEGKTTLEPYSSQGPVIHDFGPVEDSSPAAAIPEQTISKPDLVATDCVRTTFFASFRSGFWRFCGTSAAAPHAAAVAALMLNREPAAESADLRNALTASATALSGYDSCEVGVGLVEAVGALEEVVAKADGIEPGCEPPESEVDPEEAAAPGDWGSETPPPPPPPPPSGGGSGQSGSSQGEPPPPVTPRPPRTFILQHPLRVIHTVQRRALAVFLFGSNESGVSFVCRVDGGFFRPCPERLARRFPAGRHLVEVAALNAEGVGDRSPARYRFKVKTVR